jgi:hypothetical protein
VAIRIVDQMGGYFAITSKHCKIDVTLKKIEVIVSLLLIGEAG